MASRVDRRKNAPYAKNEERIPVHIEPRPQPKPWCYVCGCSCMDAGDNGKILPRHVPSEVLGYVTRRVRVCGNCQEEDEEDG